MPFLPLFTDEYLSSHWEVEFQAFIESCDAGVRDTLLEWNDRDRSLTETQLVGLFVEKVFHQLWDYWGTGTTGPVPGYTLLPEYRVPGAGQAGGTGKADLALAHFGNDNLSDIPQVLCEFKDIKSGLDAPQNRKSNNRSPVQQCLDYLKHTFDKTPIDSSVDATWGIVTDMNEFRLYYRKAGNARYQRFVIEEEGAENALIADTPAAARQRFLFCRVFSRDLLLAPYGHSELEKLLHRQWTHERSLEKHFYREYQAYRQRVYESILESNPSFSGTRGELVRITQRFLDRCIFLLFCEDMGKALSFPTDLLRDILKRESSSPSFSADFDNVWSLIKQLFRTMRDGGPFPPDHHINRFNGGLFEDLEELERIRIPNRVFCVRGQGESEEKLREFKDTLLYLAATYNFGTSSDTRERTITLYTLGRIFEQSITDLEYMHAEADGVPTIAKLSKRKRDGVYYTPEWVTSYIVQEVVGGRLADERDRLGLQLGEEFGAEDLAKYRRARKKPKSNPATVYLQRLDKYETFVDRMTILDPACGSGAFLIQALQFLQQHRQDLATERERITGQYSLFDQDAVIRSILSKNLYGVDINPESVEITQLALWLNTAAPGKPLSTLDKHVRCGNSLVGDDFAHFYHEKHSTLFEDADPNEREKVNTFDWATKLPAVVGADAPERGFDCIIGNPPYVKLQYFRKVVPDVAEYLVKAKTPSMRDAESRETPPQRSLYESTQTKNFDLYLPFIERGMSLLHTQGRMGFIAPSVWLLSDYGEGLKKRLIQSRRLTRWVDFKDFPVFEEAMTYTALQFYSGAPSSKIRFAPAPDGQLTTVQDEGEIEYESLDPKKAWVFLPDRERALIDRLKTRHSQLCDSPYVKAIFVGIQTSADDIYHLERVGPGRYRQKGSKADGTIHPIEDTIMKPLVSGGDAKRYQVPEVSTYLLFPYDVSAEAPRLWSEGELQLTFVNAWAYLKKYEASLRARERGKMDKDSSWWAYNYPKNLGKQDLPKLCVAETVPEMRVLYDSEGRFYLNNVRVNGILANPPDVWFVLGVLNSRVADFVFRRIAKPKEPRPSGAYFEANKQYIAPIPIPTVGEQQRDEVSARAKKLQELHTRRRDTIQAIDSRINSPQMRPDERKPNWIRADVRDRADWAKANPLGLDGRELRHWANSHYEQLLDAHLSELNDCISFGQTMLAVAKDGQLKFVVGNERVIDGVFVGEDEILQNERPMDDYVYELYGLSAKEREIIEAGTEQRVNARIP